MNSQMNSKRIITQEEYDNLPTEIHKKVARHLIQTGEWTLVVLKSGQ